MRQIIAKHHFTYKQVKPVEELGGRLWELEHEKSGAKLVWLDRPEENMAFAVSFKTIPENGTGVFHILEHSVLCGSERYPVKEPFVELLKSSLKTFLNAFTAFDNTTYPVASCNRQDYLNLVKVYMDAVFHPRILTQPEIFLQEGWRYEFDGEKPQFQGVVYNEMKGAYSSVDRVMYIRTNKALFPDTCYCHDSGGDPAEIPSLTYEAFIANYRKYYHPSNARIVLDGTVDLDAVLDLLDGVLSAFDRQEMDLPIPMQQPLPYHEEEDQYEIGASEEEAGRTIIGWGRIIGDYTEVEKQYAGRILADYLAGDNEAPLKHAFLQAGLGENITMHLRSGMQQPYFGWQITNTDHEKLQEIKSFLRDFLEKHLQEGLNEERLQACYNRFAFGLYDRDANGYPMEVDNILESWLYGGDPAQYLCFKPHLESLKQQLTGGLFASLIREWLLDDSTGALVVMKPSKALGEEKRRGEEERLQAKWDALSEADKAAKKELCEQVRLWQQSADTEESLATIPTLTASDLPEEPKPVRMTEREICGVKALCHSVNSDLVYLRLYFNASDIAPEELPLLALLSDMLGKLPTAYSSSAALRTKVKLYTGRMGFTGGSSAPLGEVDRCRVRLGASAVCLPEYAAETAALLQEILTSTVFEDTDLLIKEIRQQKTRLQMSLVNNGHMYAVGRAAAKQTAEDAAQEALSGCEYIRWIASHTEDDEAALRQLLSKMAELAKRIVTKDRLVLSLSENAVAAGETLAKCFPETGSAPEELAAFPLLPAVKEGLIVPAGVGYAGRCYNLYRHGMAYGGAAAVLYRLMSLEYLWNAVRVQGGAYGAGMNGSFSGNIKYYTYRDPDPARSLGCFDRCADVLKEFAASGQSLDRLILGTAAEMDPYRGPYLRIFAADNQYFCGITQAVRKKAYDEMRAVTANALLALQDALSEAAKEDNSVVIGGKAQVEACADRLTEIKELFS